MIGPILVEKPAPREDNRSRRSGAFWYERSDRRETGVFPIVAETNGKRQATVTVST